MTDSAVQGVLYGSLIASAVGMWLATSPRTAALRVLGSFLASAGLIAAVAMFSGPGGDVTNKILFWLCSAAC
jgi:NADH-quinone oxidoreductase subunit J